MLIYISILNYDRSEEERDVWSNQVTSRETEIKYGMDDPLLSDVEQGSLPSALAKTRYVKPSFYESFKWAGKPNEQWNHFFYHGFYNSLPQNTSL